MKASFGQLEESLGQRPSGVRRANRLGLSGQMSYCNSQPELRDETIDSPSLRRLALVLVTKPMMR